MNYDLIHADCMAALADMADASIDAIVTDPPYELGFMGKAWDASGIAYSVDLWREALRVLKPGGHLLAFGGTRTYHRMAVAIEDAGFEIRDSIHWLYGSGFPKSLDVSKAIDKAAGAERKVLSQQARQGRPAGILGTPVEIVRDITAPATDAARQWEGWGTALKPAHEPIVVARKPLVGTVAANVLAHGTGALNVDGCRVAATPGDEPLKWETPRGGIWTTDPGAHADATADGRGRWPTNIMLTHAADCDDQCAEGCPVAALDEQSGVSKTPARVTRGGTRNVGLGPSGSADGGRQEDVPCYGDTGGASRFFTVTEWDPIADVAPFRYVAKPSRAERNAGLDGLASRSVHRFGAGIGEGHDPDAPVVERNHHPTVKPVTLMRWLCRLVTPPGGTVLDPFAGSGTTLVAAVVEGFHAIGIEMTADYLPIIRGRVDSAHLHRDGKLARPRPQSEGQMDLFGGAA